MNTFGLIGKSLFHSYSQEYFSEKFYQKKIQNVEYLLFFLDNIHGIKELLNNPSLTGFNVTTPYKTDIIPFLDELSPVAQEVGAVNCVVKQNNKWMGYNTDVIGFEKTLQKMDRKRKEESERGENNNTVLRSYAITVLKNSALILGSGGAAKAVCYVLKQKNIPFNIVSRKKTENTITYNEITYDIINHYSFIINTTPLGMFPNIDEMPPIPYPALNHNHCLIDLIYNPEETLFLKEGKKQGALTLNGSKMFETQAESSFKLFFNL